MAVRGLQLRGAEAALEQSCGRSKLEQARASSIVAMLACGVARSCFANIQHAWANRSNAHTSDPLSLCAPQVVQQMKFAAKVAPLRRAGMED